jgi:hypothetical protein
MVSSGLLRRVALVRTDVSREPSSTFIRVFLRSVRRLLVAACVVPSSPIFVTLMKEAPDYSETSVLTRATRRNNPEDTILEVSSSFYQAHMTNAEVVPRVSGSHLLPSPFRFISYLFILPTHILHLSEQC